ncbi:hypothetical protein D3C78_1939350 [compost metagenome]
MYAPRFAFGDRHVQLYVTADLTAKLLELLGQLGIREGTGRANQHDQMVGPKIDHLDRPF